jgi:ABC-type nitrate/sulfonate/bicarbonate transport system substrate-binding protein
MTQQNPQALKAIMDGWFAALAYIQTHPDEAYTIMAKQYGMST